jgi:hypothetical protein
MATVQEIKDDIRAARRRLHGLPPLGPTPDLRSMILISTCPWCGSFPIVKREPLINLECA